MFFVKILTGNGPLDYVVDAVGEPEPMCLWHPSWFEGAVLAPTHVWRDDEHVYVQARNRSLTYSIADTDADGILMTFLESDVQHFESPFPPTPEEYYQGRRFRLNGTRRPDDRKRKDDGKEEEK